MFCIATNRCKGRRISHALTTIWLYLLLPFNTSLCAASCFTSSTPSCLKCICIILIFLWFSDHWCIYNLLLLLLSFCPLRLCLFLCFRILHMLFPYQGFLPQHFFSGGFSSIAGFIPETGWLPSYSRTDVIECLLL